jgi:ParB-like chromosome segregation protein Spo0J
METATASSPPAGTAPQTSREGPAKAGDGSPEEPSATASAPDEAKVSTSTKAATKKRRREKPVGQQLCGKTDKIALNQIDLDPAKNPRKLKGLESMKASLQRNGLLQPPVVKPAGDDKYVPLAGFRRLTAAREIDWDTVDVVVVEPKDADHERLIVLDSNLEIAQLSRPEQAEWLFERKTIHEKNFPETKRGAAGGHATAKNAVVGQSFAAAAAELTGLSERTIRNDVRMWEAASSEVQQAWKAGEIKACVVGLLVKKTPKDDQTKLLEGVKRKSFNEAKQILAGDAGRAVPTEDKSQTQDDGKKKTKSKAGAGGVADTAQLHAAMNVAAKDDVLSALERWITESRDPKAIASQLIRRLADAGYLADSP